MYRSIGNECTTTLPLEVFSLKKLCSRLHSNEVDFYSKKRKSSLSKYTAEQFVIYRAVIVSPCFTNATAARHPYYERYMYIQHDFQRLFVLRRVSRHDACSFYPDWINPRHDEIIWTRSICAGV